MYVVKKIKIVHSMHHHMHSFKYYTLEHIPFSIWTKKISKITYATGQGIVSGL